MRGCGKRHDGATLRLPKSTRSKRPPKKSHPPPPFCPPPIHQTPLHALTPTRAPAPRTRRRLRFLANVDPVDVAKALNALSPETTLVIVISKTFTTTETMLNARTVR